MPTILMRRCHYVKGSTTSLVARLGVSGTLAKTFTSTNCIESMISIAERTTGRVTSGKTVL
jgi:hypothetical protein